MSRTLTIWIKDDDMEILNGLGEDLSMSERIRRCIRSHDGDGKQREAIEFLEERLHAWIVKYDTKPMRCIRCPCVLCRMVRDPEPGGEE